jgi:hypothetical protein
MLMIGDLTAAEPGASVVYHRGFLAKDKIGNVELSAKAAQAAALAKAGCIHLVQKRLGKDRYEYLAVTVAIPTRSNWWREDVEPKTERVIVGNIVRRVPRNMMVPHPDDTDWSKP